MPDVREVTVPDIGDFADVPIIEVLVSPGDSVAPEDPLVTLESDKATMDVPAPFAGVVQDLRVSVGDTVSEGTAILSLAVDAASGNGGGPSSVAPEPTSAAAAGAVQEEAAQEAQAAPSPERVDPGAEEDGGRPEANSPRAVDTAIAAEESSEERPGGADGAGPAAPSGGPNEVERAGGDGGPVYASPSVRRLARERGVDLSRVRGTGRKGRITKEDVERGEQDGAAPAPAEAPAAAPAQAPAPAFAGLPPWPQVDFAAFGEIERVPLTRIQKLSGPNLARNWVMIPHVTHQDEADITDLEAFRKETNESYAREGVKLTMVALLVKACVASLQAFPVVNASLDGDELVLKHYYNIGFAADTPQGLVVPVIKDADRKGILDIARELTALSGAAREGKLKMGDMRGATFTISSLGGIGGTGFTPIVNAPEVAILGVTRSATKPVWTGSEFAPRLMLPLSLSYDHRVIDGALAARFTAHLASVLTDLRRALL
jgi:pyruvate dehydrogenase E2 component (dihydrolipoamide acetyltransferase)